ncbi:unnamed protein product [Candidula unifasciata]|uniref:C-type lectin domain-containing protein n=1 Tax=Candidula unifasciata TaxID=100452 RepID=A0A8S3ZAQ7_9EUPU|nr:unnamed protein product [Candidula unifasciata]
MELRGCIMVLIVVMSLYQGMHGGRLPLSLYKRLYDDFLMNVFEMAYTMSEPFNLRSRRVYFLSTYLMQYAQALEACKALGGSIAEMNDPMEYTFVANFLRTYTRDSDEVFIAGYRTANEGSFISSVGVDMLSQIIAFDEGRGNRKSHGNSSLYTYFHPNRPRQQDKLPTCLSIERRGNILAMVNGRCADENYQRYLCEADISA